MSNQKTLGQVGYEAYVAKAGYSTGAWNDGSINHCEKWQEAWNYGIQAAIAEAIRRGIAIKPPEVKPTRTPGQRLCDAWCGDGEKIWDVLPDAYKANWERIAKDRTFPPEPEPGEMLWNLLGEYLIMPIWASNGKAVKAAYNALSRHCNLSALRAEIEAMKAKEGK